MTVDDWLKIGYDSGAVARDISEYEEMTFREAYGRWFAMKRNAVKPQTLDRLECTYNRYFNDTEYEFQYISTMDTVRVSDVLTSIMLSHGGLDEREYKRLYQILNNVLVYCHDMELGHCPLIDWNKVKRYIPRRCVHSLYYEETAVSDDIIALLEHNVIDKKVYVLKQSACLCLILNFYLGLRVGELAGLRWCDVNRVDKVVHVRQTETKAYDRDSDGERSAIRYSLVGELKTSRGYRDVPLCDKAEYILDILKTYHDFMGYGNRSEYLAFDGVDGGSLVRSLDRTLRKLCTLCGILPFNTHLIRKTFASRLHSSGMPTRMISDLMGHADISTTERCYILSYDNELDKARDLMNGIYRV